ncbi:2'-deoxycytidine 5'-triphosphate deaminase [Hyphomicrobium denitrificans 1NES1]|uniref:2'-deoxycytidine 5'-triphosphate deaminase n=1 Tax=Hyphomicrobium denitrificans 1NES1 TaxID=670307 RepID=N0AYK2_9HYPH|nr:2'-deoxycytidine 5'-triphosphate deaminase [Hyphomicrobium denitrificans]AGK56219.1 2'-deoxycytidine 5'-triphosphate deaminase [Hyphomicrobium denitrificans 1NES1]
MAKAERIIAASKRRDAAQGIVPSQGITRMIASGQIMLAEPVAETQVQPASLDLRLGPVAYRVRASFLPKPGGRVQSRLDDLALHTISLSQGAVLETGCVYIVPLLESLELPADIEASANPKSSTGRLDVFTRVIADGVGAFDQIPHGYHGPLFAEICPQTFPIVVRKGSRLSQIRFRVGTAADSDVDLKELHKRERLVSTEDADISGGIALSVDLAGDAKGLVGFRARRHTGVVDVDKPDAYPIEDYWDPIYVKDRHRLILDPDQFYILASKEAVHVPPTHAAEMVPFNPLVGEFRVHYAGFMDPGFGHAPAGGGGSRVVLEVRSHKVPFILEDGQIIGRLIYERMIETPNMIYGQGLKSNYQGQGLKLSKHFK